MVAALERRDGLVAARHRADAAPIAGRRRRAAPPATARARRRRATTAPRLARCWRGSPRLVVLAVVGFVLLPAATAAARTAATTPPTARADATTKPRRRPRRRRRRRPSDTPSRPRAATGDRHAASRPRQPRRRPAGPTSAARASSRSRASTPARPATTSRRWRLAQQALEACGNTAQLDPCGYALFEVGAALNAPRPPRGGDPAAQQRLDAVRRQQQRRGQGRAEERPQGRAWKGRRLSFAGVAAALAGMPFMSPEQGRIVYDHVRAHPAAEVLELGTAHGVGAAYMAAALEQRRGG